MPAGRLVADTEPAAGPMFFLGAMSPYAWMAAERIDDLLPDARWRPITLRGLFPAVGRQSWGLTDRRATGIADCEERARERGLGPIRWPDPWPTSDVAVARAMIFAEERGRLRPFALAAMRLAFLEGGVLSEPGVLAEAAERADLDPGDVAEATSDVRVKEALRSATDEAVALGVIGVPTIVVGGAQYWGDDRLEEAAAQAASQAA